jgi:hypothetical protein
MIQPTPDHMAILSLARQTLRARDDSVLWEKDFEKACEWHGTCCNSLWEELERQIAQFDGLVPEEEHPSIKRKKMIAQIRREIIDTARNAVTAAMNDLADGPMLDKYE